MTGELLAGVARRAINPLLGTRRVGPRLYGDPIQAIQSNLTGTVCVVSDGTTTVAVLAVDLCEMAPAEATAIRQAVGTAIDTPASHVMLNMSHNHSAPGMPEAVPDVPEQQRLKERYRDDLTRWLVEAAVEARKGLRPARIGAGTGESDIGIYRRERSPDGTDILGEVPDHPIDQTVGVIRIDDLDGRPIAILFSYGCHAVVVGPRSFVATTDYPGPARRLIESSLGGMAMFLQACGGNVNPRLGIGYAIDGRDDEQRVGVMLGAEAARVAAGIRTHVKAGERTTFGNIPNILVRPWVPVEGPTSVHLAAGEEIVRLEYGPLPSMSEAIRIREHWRTTVADREAAGAQDWEVRVARMFAAWSDRLVEAVEGGHPTHDVHIQAVTINDVALVGISMETFFETGVAIRQGSHVAHTEVLGYTNGSTGYLPRREDYPEGGWRLDTAYHVPDLYVQAYLHPVALHLDSEQLIVQRAASLLDRVSGSGAPLRPGDGSPAPAP